MKSVHCKFVEMSTFLADSNQQGSVVHYYQQQNCILSQQLQASTKLLHNDLKYINHSAHLIVWYLSYV